MICVIVGGVFAGWYAGLVYGLWRLHGQLADLQSRCTELERTPDAPWGSGGG